MLGSSYVPATRCPGLEHTDLEEQSLYVVLERQYGIRHQRAKQTIEATVANEYESGLFGVDVGTPMLLLVGVTYTDDDRPAEYFKAVYRADRIRLELESRRDTGSRSETGTPHMNLVMR